MNQLVNFVIVDFICSGVPNLPAKAGVRALDIYGSKLYIQTAMPFGKKWIAQPGEYYFVPSAGGGGVSSVTGLDTNNTDPANPVVQISVDGSTITGDGTPGSPLVAVVGVPLSRKINTTAPLTGGGDLTADRTLSMPEADPITDGYLSATDFAIFDGKQNALGFTPENVANKTTNINGAAGTYPDTPTVKAYADTKPSVNYIMALIASY